MGIQGQEGGGIETRTRDILLREVVPCMVAGQSLLEKNWPSIPADKFLKRGW